MDDRTATAGTITLRPATEADIPVMYQSIRDLAAWLGEEEKVTSTPEDLRRHGFGADPRFEAVIAEVSGEFAGMCLVFPSFSTWRGTPGIYLQDVYVRPGFRGRHVGEALIARAAALGRRKGATYMRLSVDVDNVAAQHFYERIGLAHSESERIHMIKGEAFDSLARKDAGA